MLFCFRCK